MCIIHIAFSKYPLVTILTQAKGIVVCNLEYRTKLAKHCVLISMTINCKEHKIDKKSHRKCISSLDPEQQRSKHVTCEKNRRSLIRSSYDTLSDLVPGLTEEERRSEWKIYVKTRHYLTWLYDRNKFLIQCIEEQKKEIPQYLILERNLNKNKNNNNNNNNKAT